MGQHYENHAIQTGKTFNVCRKTTNEKKKWNIDKNRTYTWMCEEECPCARTKFSLINFYFVPSICDLFTNFSSERYCCCCCCCSSRSNRILKYFWSVHTKRKTLFLFLSEIFDSFQTFFRQAYVVSLATCKAFACKTNQQQQKIYAERKWNQILRILTALASKQSICNSFLLHRIQ